MGFPVAKGKTFKSAGSLRETGESVPEGAKTDKEIILRNVDEVISEEELDRLLAGREERTAYVGFEPSGTAHIGWKIVANKVRDLQEAHFTVTISLADWHAFINDKLGGNMGDIRTCGAYMEDCFNALGVDPERTRYIYASDLVSKAEYWEKVLRVAKSCSVARVRRALTIMGRSEDEADTDSSKLFYPAMQAADIFVLNVDLALGGMDQRKAHMLARDAAEKLKWRKFVALHTPLLTGLDKDGRMEMLEVKMSKSKPDSSLFLHDSPDDIRRKLKKAFCPIGVVQGNPVLEIVRYIVMPEVGKLVVERKPEHGGDLEFTDMEGLEAEFAKEEEGLHPQDLKKAVAQALIETLEPVRVYFKENPGNYKKVKRLSVTR